LVGGNVATTAKTYSGSPIKLTATTTLKTRVKSGTTWSAMVKAVYAKGDTYTSINSIAKNSDVYKSFVYPNPVKDFAYFVFDLPKAGKVEISVHDISGKIISNVYSGNRPEGTNTIPWFPDNIKQGIYIYTINYNRSIKSGKLLVKGE
jgi:hypothetical protein